MFRSFVKCDLFQYIFFIFQGSTTWFVLPSDVELYPSLDMASQFIHFIKMSSQAQDRAKVEVPLGTVAPNVTFTDPRVYVVPVFEVSIVRTNES